MPQRAYAQPNLPPPERRVDRCPLCGGWMWTTTGCRTCAEPGDRHVTFPCHRCGVPTQRNTRAKVSGVCRDCRQADPEYVRALRTGVRCA